MFLQKLNGKEHLPKMIETTEDFLLQKVYIFMEHAGSQSLEKLLKHKEGLPTEIVSDLFT